MKDKKNYIAPEIVAVTFAVEKGYAVSIPLFSILDIGDERMEDYETANNWTSGSNNFWD